MFEKPQSNEARQEPNSLRNTLMAAMVGLSALSPQEATAQESSMDRFADLPRVELESVEAGEYQKFLTQLEEQVVSLGGLIMSIESGIKHSAITSEEHIDTLLTQLDVFSESINNAQLMSIMAGPLEGMSQTEITDEIGPLVVPAIGAITAAKELLEQYRESLGEPV